MTKNMLLWLDVETTGLNPQTNSLLQVAGFVTDAVDFTPLASFNEVVRYGKDELAKIKLEADDFVTNMHEQSGLWNKLDEGVGFNLTDLDGFLYNTILEFIDKPGEIRLAGNSVKLDYDFLATYLPDTFSLLHYRVLDVSSLAFAAEQWAGVKTYSKKKEHDALADIKETMAEAVYLIKNLYSVPRIARSAAQANLDTIARAQQALTEAKNSQARLAKIGTVKQKNLEADNG